MTTTAPSREDLVRALLQRLADPALQRQWLAPAGTATRHLVMDEVFPPGWAAAIHDAFPPDARSFVRRESLKEHKSVSGPLNALPPLLTEVVYAFQDRRIVERVGEITGMRELEPDPLLYAGGLSMMFRGDFLNPHIDNSHDLKRQRYRRLNLLYYTAPDWTLEDGGNFELWDPSGHVPRTIVSTANRLVIMCTDRHSLHSVSPVRSDRPRCCVSNYYFSKQSPTGEDYFHVTSFWGRPEQPVRRLLGSVDNFARNIAGRLGFGRGRSRVNVPDKAD